MPSSVVIKRIDRNAAGEITLVKDDNSSISVGTVADVADRVATFKDQIEQVLVSVALAKWLAADPSLTNDNLIELKTVLFDDEAVTNVVRVA